MRDTNFFFMKVHVVCDALCTVRENTSIVCFINFYEYLDFPGMVFTYLRKAGTFYSVLEIIGLTRNVME